MKKLLTTLVVVLFVSGAYAQIGAGIKAGVNFANQNVSGNGFSLDTQSKTGYHFGAFFEIGTGGMFSVQPEILYSSQGSEFEFDFMGTTSRTENKFTYLNIPVLLKAEFADIVNIHAGPQFGILASAEQDGEDVKEAFKSSDVSLAFGAGVNLPMGLVGGLRYTTGLSNISDDDSTEIKNTNFQIYVGLRLFGE